MRRLDDDASSHVVQLAGIRGMITVEARAQTDLAEPSTCTTVGALPAVNTLCSSIGAYRYTLRCAAQRAVRSIDDGGVVEPVIVSLGYRACEQPDAVAVRRRGKTLTPWAIDGLSRPMRVSRQCRRVVSARPQLRQRDQIAATLGELVGERQRVVQIPFRLIAGGQPLGYPDCDGVTHFDAS